MDFILHKTLDADNVIGKVLTDSNTIQILLKSSTDIKSPDITLAGIDGLLDYNYCEIPELGIKYFIRDVSLLSAKVTRLSCEIDYLETYKDAILASAATLKRKVADGDYGDVDLNLTGRVNYENFYSNVELVPNDGAILTVLKGEDL